MVGTPGAAAELPGPPLAAATRLAAELAPLVADGVVVAFSGGVDSALLVAAALRAAAPEGAGRVHAATAVSPSLPASELAAAGALAAALGVPHHTVASAELSRPGYVANGTDRCAFCKTELVDVLRPLADRLGAAHVVTGTQADDVASGVRPGIAAARSRGALTPLAAAGLTKADVRALARAWGLPVADKPAAACLASRIRFGVPVSAAGLRRVDAAETAVRGALAAAGRAGGDLRVRDLGADRARVELSAELARELTAGGAPELTAAVLAAVRGAGFAGAAIDAVGYRAGALHELLATRT